jgi:hypothetical protein
VLASSSLLVLLLDRGQGMLVNSMSLAGASLSSSFFVLLALLPVLGSSLALVSGFSSACDVVVVSKTSMFS